MRRKQRSKKNRSYTLQLWRKALYAEAGPSLAKDKRTSNTSHSPMRRKQRNTQTKKRHFARSDEEGAGKHTLKNKSTTFPTFAPAKAEAEAARVAAPFAPFAPLAPAAAADSAETAGEATAETTA